MSIGTREDNIRRIVLMEERICNCDRCPSLIKCIRKPSLGKGELEPEMVFVFESGSTFTNSIDNIIELRNLFKSEFNIAKIYHTYMVRCQPKACTVRYGVSCYTNSRLLDKGNRCILSGKLCEGIPIKPSTEEIFACLPFLLEEIEILSPNYLILFGARVSEFVLRSFGIFSDIELGKRYEFNKKVILTTVYEQDFGIEECKQVQELMSKPLEASEL
jgi:uracil-DNA glycosylase